MRIVRIRRVLLPIAAVAALATGAVYASALERLTRQYEVVPDVVAVRSDAEALERGRHLVEVVAACTGCHGPDLSGEQMADDPWLGRLWSSNLTPGRGGIGDWSDTDLVRAVRHGVKRNGRPVLMMPAQYFYHFSDGDLGAVIAYLRSLPAVDRETPEFRLGIASAFIIASGQVPDLVPADLLAEAPARLAQPTPAATPEYGAYLVETSGCKVCHHEHLSGGRHPLALPEEPPPSDLTPGGRLAHWSEGQFIDALRTGMTPEGDRLDEEWMPWPAIGRMSDVELRAIYRYLRSLDTRTARSVQGRA
jgi:mono/diheme cytochrome c family protein